MYIYIYTDIENTYISTISTRMDFGKGVATETQNVRCSNASLLQTEKHKKKHGFALNSDMETLKSAWEICGICPNNLSFGISIGTSTS